MADRTSAGLFARCFEMLAEHKAMALKIWPFTQEYDFDEYQMGCDEALIKLGLARMTVDPRYPEDGEVVVYGPEKQP